MTDTQGRAAVYVRGNEVLIRASSVIQGWKDAKGICRGMAMDDWDAFECLLRLEDGDGALGNALRLAVKGSRINLPGELADARQAAGNSDQVLAQAFRLNGTDSLYSGMLSVSVQWELGSIILRPTRSRGGGAFGGFKLGANQGHEDIVVLFSATDAEVGAALRECIGRCL